MVLFLSTDNDYKAIGNIQPVIFHNKPSLAAHAVRPGERNAGRRSRPRDDRPSVRSFASAEIDAHRRARRRTQGMGGGRQHERAVEFSQVEHGVEMRRVTERDRSYEIRRHRLEAIENGK